MHEVIAQVEGSDWSVTYFRPDPEAKAPEARRVDPSTARPDLPMLTALLEELDSGVLVCRDDGRLALANDAARRELQRGEVLVIDAAGTLGLAGTGPTSQLQWRAALRAAVQQQRRQLLPLGDGETRLMVAVLPLAPCWALVMLGRRRPAAGLALQMLAKLYSLTQAEQSVLGDLLAGQRVEAVAQARGVKISTLRTQVLALRGKLGVGRLQDLVRLVSELPPMTGALRSPPLAHSGVAMATRQDPATRAA